jgi:hypothetical protein
MIKFEWLFKSLYNLLRIVKQKYENKMKKVFLLTVAVLFACSLSFASTSKKSEFTFGIDKMLAYKLRNSINYVDGQKVATKMENGKMVPVKEKKKTRTVNPETKVVTEAIIMVDKMIDNILSTTVSKDYGNSGIAPKLEYCYYVLEQEDKGRTGVGVGINKFFNSDFNPFNVYAIWKIALPVNKEDSILYGVNLGYGVFNDKYETTKGTFKVDKVYSAKIFVKFDCKNFIIDLSGTMNIIPVDAKINTVNGGVSVTDHVNYDTIMLEVGYKFAI